MTGPAPIEPVWLRPADVRDQLRIGAGDTADDALIVRCAAAVEPQVQRARPDLWVDGDEASVPRMYTPDAEVYQAAVMLAARLFRRRNSPGGVESFGDSVTFVSRYDPEIQRALRTGAYALPGVG